MQRVPPYALVVETVLVSGGQETQTRALDSCGAEAMKLDQKQKR